MSCKIRGWCAFPVSVKCCEQHTDHQELYICAEKQLEGKVVYRALLYDMFSLLCKAVQIAFLYTTCSGDIGKRIYFAYVLTSSVLHWELQAGFVSRQSISLHLARRSIAP